MSGRFVIILHEIQTPPLDLKEVEKRKEKNVGSRKCGKVLYDLNVVLDQKWQKMQQNLKNAIDL